MSIGHFSLDWQTLSRKDLIAAGWMEIFDASTERLFWKFPGMPEEYGFEGAKYTQGVIDRQLKQSQEVFR
jgi:hypothetical protein